jgi:alanyl-tRNA synthetase
MSAELAEGAVKVGEVSLLISSAGEVDPNGLRQIALGARDRLQGASVVVIGSMADGKGALVAAITPDLVARGVSAGDLIAAAAAELGGGGSRDPELAQAGGPNGSRLGEALELARERAEQALSAL